LAKEDNPKTASPGTTGEIDRLEKQLHMLDQRLDNLDSMVTAVVERVMSQPVSLNITCTRCGHVMEVILSGVHKPKK